MLDNLIPVATELELNLKRGYKDELIQSDRAQDQGNSSTEATRKLHQGGNEAYEQRPRKHGTVD